MFKQLRSIIILTLATIGFIVPAIAQSNQLNVQIVSYDDTFYPQIDVNFQVVDNATGRTVPLTDNAVTATLNGQNVALNDLEQQAASSTPVGIAIVFDLTNSQDAAFLDEQKNTASAIIDALSPADEVAIITFDTNGAQVVVELGRDHNLALNTIDTLSIVNGPSNQFYDGVFQAMQVLRDATNPNLRKAAIVMTDVTDPQGTNSPTDSITIGQQLNIPIYLIGFNVAEENVLTQFSQPTNGFTYMQRELEQENVTLERMAITLTDVLKTEYAATFISDLDASGGQLPLNLTVNLSGVSGQAQQNVTARQRQITIEFPNIQPGLIVSDEVTFDPNITYADNNQAVDIQTAAYYVENGGNEVLNPPDSSDPTYTWSIEEVVGGVYDLRLDVTDTVGNAGTQRFQIEVESPIAISFVSPLDDPNTPTENAEVRPGDVPVEVAIEGSFRINEVSLYVDNQLLETLTEEPYVFNWDTSSLAGQYVLRVEASDIQNNRTQTSQTVNVAIPEGIGILAIGIIIAIAALIIILIVILILRRRTDEAAEIEADVSSAAGSGIVPPIAAGGSAIPVLKVVRGVADNGIQVYRLDRPVLRIGRSRQNDIRVIGEQASRNHSQVVMSNGQYTYRDNDPSKANRSKLNGQELHSQHVLQEGDRITIDQTEFMFTYHQ